MTKFLYIRHKATGKTALGLKAPDGCVLAQFDHHSHRHSHGWHLYPRGAFVRRRDENIMPTGLRHTVSLPGGGTSVAPCQP